MTTYRVEFQGSLGNLAQWDAAIRNTVNANAQAMEAATKKIFANIGNIQPYKSNESGTFYRNLKTQVDGINRTFIQSGQVVGRVLSDWEVKLDKLGKKQLNPVFSDQYVSQFREVIGDLDAYEIALKKTAGTEAIIANQRLLYASRQGDNLEKQRKAEENLDALQKKKTQQTTTSSAAIDLKGLQADLASGLYPKTIQKQVQNRQIVNGKSVFASGFTTQNVANPDYIKLTNQIVAAELEVKKLTAATDQQIAQAEAGLKRLIADYKALGIAEEAAVAQLMASNPAYAQLDAAAKATPPIQKDLATALQRHPDLQKNLLKQGLGGGVSPNDTEGFKRALADQEAQVTRYTKNMRTGITNIQGSFRDADGIVNTFTADIDKQGKVVGRWGGNLAGAGTYLKQTVRDFQKVVQWTVATTLVFGTLAATVGQLRNINELNTDLTRLSITAQTTAEETNKLFEGLGQVSIATATPLKEIVDIADDVALATREAGQSTDEWTQKIIELTTAVGIYTNLTGVDTVEATDQLSAAFKQLDIAPSELVGVLSKVSAVAGGQSQAIADITKSLAGLSEAAKAAGFTLDEQIASVQVLSQVTNKSADEIATAFKNLFGSVSSVGSVKILKEFGIEVRDASGGVRDFLDIYRDVADALDKGIIPQNRLPDVLRGIAGGPRRAPDAAALLSNLGRVDEVIGKSVGASNEALIANAKILDTNAAKITQLQNTIDIQVFKQLSQTVEDLVDLLTKFGTVAANAFGAVPPQVISMLTQLGLVVVVTKSITGLIKILAASFKTTFLEGTIGVKAFNTQLMTTQQINARLAGTPAGGAAGGIGIGAGKLSAIKKFGKIGIGAGLALGGAAALSQGGVGLSDIGTLTQALGGIAAFVPGLQAVGVAALLVGTGLQVLGGEAKKTEKSSADLAKEIYTLTQNMLATQEAADGYAKAQKEALDSISFLQSKTEKTIEDTTALSSALQKYVENTLSLSAANREAGKSFDELLSKMQAGLPNFKDYAITNPNSPGVKKLLQDLSRQILEASGQSLFNTEAPISYSTGSLRRAGGGSSQLVTAPGLMKQFDFNSAALLGDSTLLNKLVDDKGGLKIRPQDINQEAVGYIQTALKDLVEKGPEGTGLTKERIQQLVNALQGLTASVSSFDQNTIALAQQQSQISAKVALGVFTQDQGKAATQSTNLIGVLNDVTRNPARPQNEMGAGRQIQEIEHGLRLIEDLGKAATEGVALTNAQLIEVGTTILKLTGNYAALAGKGQEAVNRGIVEALKQAGASTEQIDSLMKLLNLDTIAAAESAQKYAAALQEASINAKATARENFAQRSLGLIAAKNSGEFDKNAAGLKTLEDQNVAAYNSTLTLLDSINQLSEEGFVDLANSLSEVNGLQNLYVDATSFSAATDEEKAATVQALTDKLLSAALAAGLNADQIKELTKGVLTFTAALDQLPVYKQVFIEVKTHYTSLGVPDQYAAQSAGVAASEAAQKAQDKAAKTLQDLIKKLFNTGKGSSLGKLPSTSKTKKAATGAQPDISLLDIPDEITNSGNYQQLLQTAIKNAKNLQSLVPGAGKKNKSDIVELLDGTKRVLEVRGVGEEYLRRALDELTGQIKKNNDLLSKADTIRRIRVGAGDFSALANVPVNSRSGVSVGGPNGPINVTLNLNGTVLTPAQFAMFADQVAASIKQQLTN